MRRRKPTGLIVALAAVTFIGTAFLGYTLLEAKDTDTVIVDTTDYTMVENKGKITDFIKGEIHEIQTMVNNASNPKYIIHVGAWEVGGSGEKPSVGSVGSTGALKGDNPINVTLTAIPNSGYVFDHWEFKKKGEAGARKTEKNPFNVSVTAEGEYYYSAFFKPEKFKVEFVEISPAEGAGKLMGEGSFSRDYEQNIEITPASGYEIDNWYYTDSDGVKHSGTESKFKIKMTDDVYLHVLFRSVKVKVRVASMAGGHAEIDSETNREIEVERGEEVKIRAVPEREHEFYYWVNQNGDQFKGTIDSYGNSELTIKANDDINSYTAYFIDKDMYVSISANPAKVGDKQIGQVKLNDNPYVDSKVYSIPMDSDIALTAQVIDDNYKFERWDRVDEDGKVTSYTSNPLTIPDVMTGTVDHDGDGYPDPIRFIAYFTPKMVSTKVMATPPDGGKVYANGKSYEVITNSGEKVTLTATMNDGYYVDYWKDSRGNKYTGTDGYSPNLRTNVNTLELESVLYDETYTVYYMLNRFDITYRVDSQNAGKVSFNGGEYVSSGSASVGSGTSFTLTAKADDPSEYTFSYWIDDQGNKYNGNPLEITNIKEKTEYTAIFTKYSVQDTGGIIVYASPASGGFVSKKYSHNGKSATLNATPNSGYSFVCWKKGKKQISTERTVTVKDLKDGTEYVAYFTAQDGANVRTGLVDEHFYRDKRHHSSPNYTVTRESLTFLAKAQILQDTLNNNDTPGQRSYAAFANAAAYYEKHLKGDEYVFADGELVTTKGEQFSIDIIPSSDSAFADESLEFTNNKFGEKYSTEIIAAVDVASSDKIEKGPRTYLWRNTGACKGDNIYLLYSPYYGSGYQWSTGIVNDDASLQFTIEGDGVMVRIAAVRVTIE